MPGKQELMKLVKSEIRIVHVLDPEIVNTNTANFREVVQRLTGKPATDVVDAHAKSTNVKKRKAVWPEMMPCMKKEAGIGRLFDDEMGIARMKVAEEDEMTKWRSCGWDFLGDLEKIVHGYVQQQPSFASVDSGKEDCFGLKDMFREFEREGGF
ncbi:hypothetical protein ZOSMA_17G01270 [Zostera marina]|uniref:VQ domain-containing protein n=1 Tax=Zostera marina TaxID=29655 RepID=A0A0K9PRI2_ZOSMR|nr:hypothetical protein ZOSMA_17G01270 [Zostera marina]